MSGTERDKPRFKQGVEIIVGEAKAVAKDAFRRSGVESISEGLRETLDDVLSAREGVVMVRLNKGSLARLDDLVEAEVVGSRSESAAFLIGEGIKARAGLFDRISSKIEEIRQAKQQLRELLDEPEVDKIR